MYVHPDAKTRARNNAAKFEKEVVKKYNNRFDYSKSIYLSVRDRIEIICPDHGSFWQTPNNHLNTPNGGCPECKHEYLNSRFSLGKNGFIEKANQVHNNYYNYDRIDYRNLSDKIAISCPQHGEFWQNPASHLKGYGCPSCAGRVVDMKSFVNKAITIHGDKYDYHEGVFISVTDPIKIICPDHGEFWQTPANHCNNKSKCAKCSGIHVTDTNTFTNRANLYHNGKYDCSEVQYLRHDVPVKIICPDHGEFWQTPNTHLTKGVVGCPTCAKRNPKWESDLAESLSSWGITLERRVQHLLPGRYEYDFYLPDHDMVIEMCGLYWHSHEVKQDSKYHWWKYDCARKSNLHLITIFEDEWVHRREIVLNVLRYKLGMATRGVPARKCEIRVVPGGTATDFLDQHHLQGSVRGTHIGAYYDDELIGIMTFGNPTRQRTNGIELKRFVTNGCAHPGLANRLFHYYIRDYQPSQIVSFSDHRWFNGDLYRRLGFRRDGTLPPDYSYCSGTQRFHKSRFRKSQIAKKFPEIYQPDITEGEMMNLTPYTRIYDCGKTRWVWESHL